MVGRTKLVSGGFEGCHETYGEVIPAFAEHSHLIRWDFPKKTRAEFDGLCSAITIIEHPTVYGPSDREKAQKHIDAIISFVEKAGV